MVIRITLTVNHNEQRSTSCSGQSLLYMVSKTFFLCHLSIHPLVTQVLGHHSTSSILTMLSNISKLGFMALLATPVSMHSNSMSVKQTKQAAKAQLLIAGPLN